MEIKSIKNNQKEIFIKNLEGLVVNYVYTY